jgi:hypothetical protein
MGKKLFKNTRYNTPGHVMLRNTRRDTHELTFSAGQRNQRNLARFRISDKRFSPVPWEIRSPFPCGCRERNKKMLDLGLGMVDFVKSAKYV